MTMVILESFILSLIILAVIRQSVYQICGAYLCAIAPRQHTSIQRNVAVVASRWQNCVRFDRPEI